MKIIKHGTGKKFYCECGCIFIAEEGEYRTVNLARNEHAYKCKCPDCGAECVMSDDNVNSDSDPPTNNTHKTKPVNISNTHLYQNMMLDRLGIFVI